MAPPSAEPRVSTTGPISAAIAIFRFGGHPYLTLAVKATLALAPDADMRLLAPEPAIAGDPGDLVPYLPAAEVLVLGAPPSAAGRLAIYGEGPLVDKLLRAADPPLARTPDRAHLERGGGDVPRDFDWSRLHAAPPDQRARELRGNEWLLLEGLAAGHPRLRSRLPDLAPTAEIHGLGAPAALRLRADTLRIDAARLTCAVIWRGLAALPDGVDPSTIEARTLLDRPMPELAPQASLERPTLDRASLEGTLLLSGDDPPPPALPFAPTGRQRTVVLTEPPATPSLPFLPAPPSSPRPEPNTLAEGAHATPWSGTSPKPPPSPADFEGTLDLTAALLAIAPDKPAAPPPAPNAPAPIAPAPILVPADPPPTTEAPAPIASAPIASAPIASAPIASAPVPAAPRPVTAPRKSVTGMLYGGFENKKR